ncbi:MAG: hypothetical protein K2O69_05370 [Odoribacter sp.]|nr:hypothetical protein [Odoribacter sp.]
MKVDSTAFIEMSKSFGNLTTYKLKGQNIVRRKVTKVANPKTLKQLQQRLRFALSNKLADCFLQAIVLGLVDRKACLSAANYFVSLNKDVVTVSKELEATIDFPAIVVAKGNRAMPEGITLTHNAETGAFTVEVEAEEFMSHAADDDEFFCYVCERTKLKGKLFSLGERGTLTTSTLNLPQKWDTSPENLAFYVFCVAKDRKRASNSVYLTVE